MLSPSVSEGITDPSGSIIRYIGRIQLGGHEVLAYNLPAVPAEQLIASTRLSLAAFSLFGLALHPVEPTRLGWFRLAVVILYGVYAALLAKGTFRVGAELLPKRFVHVGDIGACLLFLLVSGQMWGLFAPF